MPVAQTTCHCCRSGRRQLRSFCGIFSDDLARTHLILEDGEKALQKAREAVKLISRSQAKIVEFHVQTLAHPSSHFDTRPHGQRRDRVSSTSNGRRRCGNGREGLGAGVLIERACLARLLWDKGRYRIELSEAHRLLTEMGATRRAAGQRAQPTLVTCVKNLPASPEKSSAIFGFLRLRASASKRNAFDAGRSVERDAWARGPRARVRQGIAGASISS